MANTGAQYGLIEAGGTKFVLGIAGAPQGDAPPAITARHQIPTTTPAATLAATIAWFREQGFGEHDAAPKAIGIASFGPLDLDRASPSWGHVTRTPKPHWSNADLCGPLAQAFGCPVAIETDVNGAALAEARWGAGKDLPASRAALLYLTIGTGVGGGYMSGGRLLHGLSHPEMGHIRLPRHPDDSNFSGACPFHGDCLEGLAAGPAIIQRWGQSLSQLGPEHPACDIIAWYLGHAVATFQAMLEPARIVLGGGVMGTPGLLDKVRKAGTTAGAGYFVGNPAEVVVSPGLGTNSGLLGALAVALMGEAQAN